MCAALVCHPHPKGGGTMHNKVVYHAMKVLNAREWGFCLPVLRFNFRGTGRSEGTHDGRAESDDVLTALHWIQTELNLPILLAGFSFGAAMAIFAACQSQPPAANLRALVALGLPTQAENRHYPFTFLRHCSLPKLFLSGDQDMYAPKQDLEQIVTDAAPPKTLVLLPGADHFFAGQLDAMQNALACWLKEQLG